MELSKSKPTRYGMSAYSTAIDGPLAIGRLPTLVTGGKRPKQTLGRGKRTVNDRVKWSNALPLRVWEARHDAPQSAPTR